MELLGGAGPQRNRSRFLAIQPQGRTQHRGEVRIRGPTPGTGFRAGAVVRDLGRKAETQRGTWEESEVLGGSCPPRVSQLYPRAHFLSRSSS